VKRGKSGLTLVELLTVLAIMALLVAVLIPALGAVRTAAKEAKQKGQLMTIELALTAFKNDYGDYPPSAWTPTVIYCGAHKLSEALLGWDLLGFQPGTGWTPDGAAYNSADLSGRKGPYLELGTTSAFRLDDLYDCSGLLTGYVLCDVFGATLVAVPSGKRVKAGAPILYYKANPSGTTIYSVYDANDNYSIVDVKDLSDGGGVHPWMDMAEVYHDITDPKIFDASGRLWPYRPDSYILISAGADGVYGTDDDIRNFGD
jgi:prepilin-type N-terminal cleavage/methylation domain-containing protein